MDNYDVIVIGAGHAGIEAALACARMGAKTLILTLKRDTIGLMSCNPAIGGVGKGQLVKEADALGAEMAKAADACGIQFRILNASKGAAVQSSRAQIDRNKYKQYMQKLLQGQENLFIKEAEASSLIVEGNFVRGVLTNKNEEINSSTVIICPGTFLDGLIHIGLNHFSAGRIDEPAASGLAKNLKELGFNLLRFKTGTCPRLDKNTINFSQLTVQQGDSPARPFSFSTKEITQRQIPCHITYTNNNTHKIIRDNLDESPLYTGIIKATGVRYCPSIEDKVVKFSDKQRHQVFLEPEGYESDEVYPNGLATSLPEEAQLKILHSIGGLENVRVIKFGYGIEHTVVEPTQLYPTLETKLIKNLYLAGQINGTTGYEEAAAQGLVAGINAALRVKNKEPLILDRASSYIGVLIDDLTTKGTNEPYRMFTSRVEYRLILREDNADLRLRKTGYDLGLVSKADYEKSQEKEQAIKQAVNLLKTHYLKPTPQVNNRLADLKTSPIRKVVSLEEILKRPEISFKDLEGLDGMGLDIQESALRQAEIEVKYAGFIQRQLSEVERFKNLEKIRIPRDLDYGNICGLSREIKEKLHNLKPINLGQASRISGVTPVAISLLMVYLKKISLRLPRAKARGLPNV
ncbi:MAG: tRNA uridine-5-carboxymethylaminomethyl(34) synthesis enzyme MnmG [Candidatus Omnitrophica bacterium]|nr:tRNA uridine-5-carboxymethylaminomethyl(34) synthesis enzyme MnmG [Candidatus Omnitrophota bacterium]MDD5592095.1 tRNA uridine-5-carboxymethylaminomethyl(34) synthesis enzyme MnmG [Candidatus Omnitrophota bacterium]